MSWKDEHDRAMAAEINKRVEIFTHRDAIRQAAREAAREHKRHVREKSDKRWLKIRSTLLVAYPMFAVLGLIVAAAISTSPAALAIGALIGATASVIYAVCRS